MSSDIIKFEFTFALRSIINDQLTLFQNVAKLLLIWFDMGTLYSNAFHSNIFSDIIDSEE